MNPVKKLGNFCYFSINLSLCQQKRTDIGSFSLLSWFLSIFSMLVIPWWIQEWMWPPQYLNCQHQMSGGKTAVKKIMAVNLCVCVWRWVGVGANWKMKLLCTLQGRAFLFGLLANSKDLQWVLWGLVLRRDSLNRMRKDHWVMNERIQLDTRNSLLIRRTWCVHTPCLEKPNTRVWVYNPK